MSRNFTYCATKGAKYLEAVKQRLHAMKQWSPDEIRVWHQCYFCIFFNILLFLLILSCHTLISFGDHCLSICRPCLTTSKHLTPIIVESVKFQDVLERKHPKTRKRGCISISGRGVNKLSSPNFVQRQFSIAIQTSIDRLGKLNTHHHGICKVLWRFEKKSAEKHKRGVFSKNGGCK